MKSRDESTTSSSGIKSLTGCSRGHGAEPLRRGVLLASPDPQTRTELCNALRAVGLECEATGSLKELGARLVAGFTDPSAVLPEVWVIDARLIDSTDLQILSALEAAGCDGNVIAIIPQSWPRVDLPEWVENLQHLHEPVPPMLFVEEVAALATTASMTEPAYVKHQHDDLKRGAA